MTFLSVAEEFSLLATVLLAQPVGAQWDFEHLAPIQRAAIDRGEVVRLTRDRLGSAWPAVSVFLYIDATPEEATAVFIDYGLHSSYIPRVKQSRVSRVVDATTAEVEYAVELPLVSDEEYAVRDHLSADRVGGFRVEWTLIRATSTKATVGHARFLPHVNARTGRSGTLLEYYTFVTPGSRLAGLTFIKSRAIRQVESTARAIQRKVEMERRVPGALTDRIAALRASITNQR